MFLEKILWSFQGFISVPCQPFGRRGIPSGRSSVSNIRPDDGIIPSGHPSVSRCFKLFKISDSLSAIRTTCYPVRTPICPLLHSSWTTCHTVRTPDRPVSSIRTTYFSRPNPTLYREASVPACIRPDLSASHPNVHQWSISFRFFLSSDMGRLIHRPDDVVSRPDALIHKARIGIQISSSGRQSALVETRAHQLRKLLIRLQPFGRLPPMVRTHA
jgi:hypothetical protein